MSTQRYGLGHIAGPTLARAYAAAEIVAPAEYEEPVVIPILNQGSTPQCEAYTGVEGRTITESLANGGALWAFDPADLFRLAHGGPDGTTTAAIEAALRNPGALATTGPEAGCRLPVASCQGVSSLAALKAALLVEHFAGLAMDWPNSWFHPVAGVLPKPGGGNAGGHMFRICGWSDARKALHIANSWGTAWGANGYAWLPYEYLPSVLEAYTQVAEVLDMDDLSALTPIPGLEHVSTTDGSTLYRALASAANPSPAALVPNVGVAVVAVLAFGVRVTTSPQKAMAAVALPTGVRGWMGLDHLPLPAPLTQSQLDAAVTAAIAKQKQLDAAAATSQSRAAAQAVAKAATDAAAHF